MLLFASRDVWFVVGLPVYLEAERGWSFWETGAFLAVWVIFYGAVQMAAPRLVRRRVHGAPSEPNGRTATTLAFVLAAFPAAIAIALAANTDPALIVVVGLMAFGVAFALNSAVHSYLILRYADGDRVAMNVGFYYMANAAGRLAGTILSGVLYQWKGLEACLWVSVVLVLGAGGLSLFLPRAARSRVVRSPPSDRSPPAGRDPDPEPSKDDSARANPDQHARVRDRGERGLDREPAAAARHRQLGLQGSLTTTARRPVRGAAPSCYDCCVQYVCSTAIGPAPCGSAKRCGRRTGRTWTGTRRR